MDSPKQRFLRTPAAKPHFELTVTNNFQQAIDAAILQVVFDNSTPISDPEQAQAAFHRISGAVQFAKTLSSLGTDAQPDKKPNISNLDHRVK